MRKELTIREVAAMGGAARADKLTAKKRRAIARAGGLARAKNARKAARDAKKAEAKK